ncbi:tripartite tricarboxylate transporter substrate binding protein [Bordetella bronchiseptica]
MRRQILLPALAIAGAMIGAAASAQPRVETNKPISIVVPFSPGGSTDTMARILREGMAKALNEQVIVVNQPGASGSVAAAAIKRAEPDGKHLFLGTIAALSIYPVLYASRIEYDPLKDFTPVMLVATMPLVVVVPGNSPFKTLQELTAYLKKNGEQANYASAGNGSSPHLGAELYKTMAHVNAVHVPYKGGNPALLGLASGETTFMVAVAPEVKPFIEAGKLRALAVTTQQRIAELPDIPTVSESGLPGYEITSWYAFVVRAGTPPATVARLHDALATALKDNNAVNTLKGMGFLIEGGAPDQLHALMKSELAKWRQVVDTARISAK